MNQRTEQTFLKRLRLSTAGRVAAVSILLPGLAFLPATGVANPQGGVVTQGAAEINAETLGHLMVLQQSDRAVINWESFNIAPGEITEFIQPGANSVALSRVTGGDPSAIYGLLKANGGHILVNKAGILVGPGGRVDVGGMNVLSTLDIDDADFMAGGDMRFVGDTAAGVTNFGTITSAAGDVILMGNFVENNGTIGAVNGTVALAAGGEILLSSSGEATVSVLRGGVGGDTGVTNTGDISAASVELKAHGNIYALAVNNSGTIRATGVSREGGRVVLSAPGGTIRNTGNIEAVASDGNGGEILIEAPDGSVELDGGEIRADGVGNGDGGSITVVADSITADGGVQMSANGANGGTILIGGDGTTTVAVGDASIEAIGSTGAGGVVAVAGDQVTLGADSVINATGATVGGQVSVNGANVIQEAGSVINVGGETAGGALALDASNVARIAGEMAAFANQGIGGRIDVTADRVVVGPSAVLDASGTAGGGDVNVGGGFQGQVEGLRNSSATTVGEGAVLRADAIESGNAGQVVVWSDRSTLYQGEASASALAGIGNGGTIEISGRENLYMWGSVAATSTGGRAGTVLFDPGDVTVGGAGSTIPVATINATLQGGTNVIVATEDGSITFENLGGGGADFGGAEQRNTNIAVQWTNSLASFGAYAGGNIIIENHIRTSGRGSINLIAGWGGQESDLATPGFEFAGFDSTSPPDGIEENWRVGSNAQPANAGEVENTWEYYVEQGLFGLGNGVIVIGDGNQNRHIEVGSRYGNTNVATSSLFLTAADTNGESRHVHLGFRDSGQVFALRRNLNDGGDLDLNNRALEIDDAPAVGIVGVAEADVVGGDGIVDGVRAINHTGVVGDTFIPYANLTNSSRGGNWWWQQIDAANPDPLLVGGNRPEHGAGTSDIDRADINVVATNSVIVQGGGRHGGSAQIGHGGSAEGWADNRSLRNGGVEQGQNVRFWSYNGASNDRTATSIARLAPVYGNINVLAGVDRATVQYNRNAQTRNVVADLTGGGGVTVQGIQRMGSSNNPSNPEQNNGSNAASQIGHGGIGQFGEFYGDIYVGAGGSVVVKAGSQSRDYGMIGHGSGGYSYWDPPSNKDAQVRIFANDDDFDNPNLRRGALYDFGNYGGTANIDFFPLEGENAGATERSNPDYVIFDPKDIQSGQTNPIRNGGGISDAQTGANGTLGIATGEGVDLPKNAVGPNTDLNGSQPRVEALGGVVNKVYAGDITIESNGSQGLVIQGFETPDTSDPSFDYVNEPTSARNGILVRRDRRFAMVGHGGASFAVWGEEAGFVTNRFDRDREIVQLRLQNSTSRATGMDLAENSTRVNRSPTWMTIQGDIDVTTNNGGVTVRGGNNIMDFAMIGHGGVELADYETANFINGDITITGDGNLIVEGGGRVKTTADIPGNNRSDYRNFAQIGHGGYRTGFQSFTGDIDITMGGGLLVRAGSTRNAYAQIGHQGSDSWGQSGGNFSRMENYWFDSWSTNLTTSLDETSAMFTTETSRVGRNAAGEYGNNTDYVDGALGTLDGVDYVDRLAESDRLYDTQTPVTYTFDAAGGSISDANGTRSNAYLGHSGNTANISVVVGGDVTMDHHKPIFQNDNELVRDQTGFIDGRFVWSMIGHGGRNTDSLRWQNPAYRYDDKSGNITLDAGGNITMNPGLMTERFTVIGHGGGDANDSSRNSFGSQGFELGGVITVNAGGDLTLDALGPARAITFNDERNFDWEFDEASDRFANFGVPDPSASLQPTQRNMVKIGHGASFDELFVYVVDGVELHGIDVESEINVNVGNDLTLQGGSGYQGSQAQIGHGMNELQGDVNGRAGFEGDITVNVGNDARLIASPNGWVPSGGTGANPDLAINGAAAVIGHGGHFLDAPASGDISVFVGNDLEITGSQRRAGWDIGPGGTQGPEEGAEGESFDSNGSPLGSYGNLAKIGHWSSENDVQQQAVQADHDGDITVVVTNNLIMRGGTTENFAVETNPANVDAAVNLDEPVVLAISQIGHSGPGVEGLKTGDITILVGNDIETFDGTISYLTQGDFYIDPGTFGYDLTTTPGLRTRALPNVNNYVQIGHGDWLRDGPNGPLPPEGGGGSSNGDITVAAGRNVTLDHTLVGHADPAVKNALTSIIGGTTTVMAGRDFPFWDGADGDGSLNAFNDSVFTTSFFGADELRFYVADRESNNLGVEGIRNDPNLNGVRLNDATAVYRGAAAGGVSFADDINPFTVANGSTAGDPDEIYLQPDLWWNDDMISTLFGEGDVFPTSLADVPGGAISVVDAPGGIPNLVALNLGDAIGSGTTEYNNTLGFYSIYYDAIQPVSDTPFFPTPPVVIIPPEIIPPIIIPPFDFLPFVFVDKYDSYDRWNKQLDPSYLSYLEGVGLLSRLLSEEEGEPGVGLRYESEFAESLAEILGFPVDETDEAAEDAARERDASRYSFMDGLYGIYYWVPVGSNELSSYSSGEVFGTLGTF